MESALRDDWREAIDAEIQSLEDTETFEVCEFSGEKTVSARWIFKTKLRSDGTVERRKARLVARGYQQIQGID